MRRTDLMLAETPWIDIVSPTKDGLIALSEETGIPLRPLLNCLDPEHLPKYEVLDETTFVILRVIDRNRKTGADCIEELTTKLAFFQTPTCILTVHRLDLEFVQELREKALFQPKKITQQNFVRQLVTGTVMSYDMPLTDMEKKADAFEENIFQGRKTSKLLRDGYLLKRKASAFRKVLKFTLDVISKFASRPEYAWDDIQGLREIADRLLFYTDDVQENVTVLLNLHVALSSQKTNEASYRTNEIVRVLTVFSIFFLPLNFIAGIYGMNFKYMPELDWPHGYFATLAFMGVVAVLIFVWMALRGWLSPADHDGDPATKNR